MLRKVDNISIQKFQKGLNTNSNFFLLEPGQSPAALNVNWGIDGSLSKRYGVTSQNTVALEGTGGWGMYNLNITLPGIDNYVKLLLHCNGTQDSTTFSDEIGKTVNNLEQHDTYTKLMLHCDGADGSTTFTDEIGKTVTANGNAQIDTAQYKFGTASGLFDGTGDYLSLADSADWNLGNVGAGNFTIEFWVRFNSIPAADINATFVSAYSAPNGWIFSYRNGLSLYVGGYEALTWSPVVNTWYHVALVRSGGTLTGYINGTSIGTYTDVNFANYALQIGSYSGGSGAFDGWLDEIRISKGIARWTANFTAPTRAYGKIYVDTAQKKFGTGSGLVDGQGPNLSLADSDDWHFGTDNFTIDNWIYVPQFLTSLSNMQVVGQYVDTNNFWLYGVDSSRRLILQFKSGGGFVENCYTTQTCIAATATWYHMATVRNGSNALLFCNGSSFAVTEANTFGAVDVGNLANSLTIGATSAGGTINNCLNGQIDELRVSKGIARWTANFTVPTDEYSNANYQANRLIVASGTGLYWSTNLGQTFTMCGSSRSQDYHNISFIKNWIIDCTNSYDVPYYWNGSSETVFAPIATSSAPTCKYPIAHQGYAFLLNETNNKRGVYYCDENNIFTTASWSNFKLPSDINDEITGTFILKKFLYIHTKNKIFKLMFVGGNPDWSYVETKNWGFVPKTAKKIQIPNVGEVVVGLDYSKRLRIFTGADDEVISSNIEVDNGVTPFYMNNINGSYLERCWAENDTSKQLYKLFVPYGSSTYPNMCVIFDYRLGGFYAYDYQNYNSGIISTDTANGQHMIVADSSGYVYETDISNADSGRAINDYWQSHFLYKNSPVTAHKAQKMYMYFKPTSSGTLYIEDREDFSNVWATRDNFNLTSAVSSVQVEQAINLPTIANVYQFKISSSANKADPWFLNRVDYLETDLGVGKS